MALVIEDGSIVEGADSYVSLLDAQRYATSRGITTELTEALLLKAVDYVNAYRKVFKGTKLTPAHIDMQWPRKDVEVDYLLLPNNVIPECVIRAQIETAVEMGEGFDPLETISNKVLIKEKVDVLEFEYDPSKESESGAEGFVFRKIRSLLRAVIIDSYGRTSR